MTDTAQSTPLLQVEHLSCGYSGSPVLADVSFTVSAGRATVLLGRNGVGKTTLFKTILGLLPALSGCVSVCGRELASYSRRAFAQTVAYVPQDHDAAFGFTVREMVLMGRTPALAGLSAPSKQDEAIAAEVMERLGLARLAGRTVTDLSGGERQMVLIARALAVCPRLLLMDEPCANLDLANQVLVLEQVAQLVREGLSVLMVSHDPNHALALDADTVCVGRDGAVMSGVARDTLTAPFLSELYGVEVASGCLGAASGDRIAAAVPVVRTDLLEKGC